MHAVPRAFTYVQAKTMAPLDFPTDHPTHILQTDLWFIWGFLRSVPLNLHIPILPLPLPLSY